MEVHPRLSKAADAGAAAETPETSEAASSLTKPTATATAVRERLEIGSGVLHTGHSLVLGAAVTPPPKPAFAPMEANPLMAKLQAFLPQMASANETLNKVEDKSQLDIENTEGAEQVVSMDVALVPLDSNNTDIEDPEKLEDLLLSRAGSQAGTTTANASSSSSSSSSPSSSSITIESNTSSAKRPVLVETIGEEEEANVVVPADKQQSGTNDDL